ncbi:MAG: hypothetical protein WAM60_13025, partial [Candidatus Promineifilaceae bacterium]
PMRLLSFIATMLTAVLIFYIGRRESGDWAVSLVGAALFLAGYRITGGWYEVARVDPLYNFLMMAGIACAIYGRKSHRLAGLAGLLLALSFLTKQNGLFAAAVTEGYLFLVSPEDTLWFGLAFTLTAVPPVLFLLLTTNGWFTHYVVDVAYASPIDRSRIFDTVRIQLFGTMLIPWLAYLLAGITAVFKEKWRVIQNQPWLLFIGMALFISISGRASVGGALNNLIPAWAFLCLAPALLAGIIAKLPNAQTDYSRRLLASRTAWQYSPLYLALIFQFSLTLGTPLALLKGELRPGIYRPTEAMKTAGDDFVERLEGIDGPVWVMMHPYYALLTGQEEPGVHIQSLWHARLRGETPLPDDLVGRIQSHYYAAIVSDNSGDFERDPPLEALLNACYRPASTLTAADAPITITGVPLRPQVIYVPKIGECR